LTVSLAFPTGIDPVDAVPSFFSNIFPGKAEIVKQNETVPF
jgi:hypothetical protein